MLLNKRSVITIPQEVNPFCGPVALLVAKDRLTKSNFRVNNMERQNCLMILIFYYIRWLCHFIIQQIVTLSKYGHCSIVAVTFMSHDLGNHVLCRVCHLVNRIVVFLESRVFSSLSKLLQS